MGNFGLSRLFRCVLLAGVVLGAAFLAVVASASPAAAKGDNDNDVSQKPWDTDNLRFGTYSAKSFNIPFHDYSGYSGVAACQSRVADGFFQTDNSVVNDFPVLVSSGRGGNATWSLAAGSAGNNAGCDTFVAQQDRLAAQIASGSGYALDETGKLAAAPTGAAYTTGRTSLNYGAWTAVDSSGYTLAGTHGGTSDSRYLARADGHRSGRTVPRAVSPATATWTVPSPGSSSTGNFGSAWHGTTMTTTTPGYLTPPVYETYCLFRLRDRSCPSWRERLVVPSRWVPPSTTTSDVRVALNVSYHLPKAKSVDLCPTDFHPRGEDSYQRIGRSTGRSLTGLSHADGQTADRFWCRSDLRYLRTFKAEHHTSLGAGITRHADAVTAGSTFEAYGRLNCYYTSTSIAPLSSGGYRCVYMFPLPQCTSGGTRREFTASEIASAYTVGAVFTAAQDGSTPCSAPPTLADFTADPCVTATVSIYENRPSGENAEPGVVSSDRTLAVAAGRTAWDLDIASPHPQTASAPLGTGDASGCADGSESRADHSSVAGAAARKQSPAPSYAASGRTDTAVPPNDADGDIGYRGAARNLAHRYASLVAENTCAVKRAEAEAELSLLELREDAFTQWLTDYKTAADRYVADAAGYTRAPQQSGSGLAVLRFNDQETNKATYASLLSTRYSALSTALAAAKTAYDTATDRTAGASRAAVIQTTASSGCVAHYDAEIARLKTLFSSAEASALGTGASGISEEQNAVVHTSLVTPDAVSFVPPQAPAFTLPTRDGIGVFVRSETRTVCHGAINLNGDCVQVSGGCGAIFCHGVTEQVTDYYYTCARAETVQSGSVTGTYAGTSRTSSYSTTHVAPSRGEATSRDCPQFAAQTGGTVYADAVSDILGTPGTASALPSSASVSAPDALQVLGKASLLGNYYLSHTDRANLKASTDSDRRSAGGLQVSVGSAPAGSPVQVTDYQSAYKTAYDTAFTRASGHMSGTAWNNFDWRYQISTLGWVGYQEDPATTFSASTATPRAGTGCDLISVAADGTTTVSATRLDFETSSYGNATVYGTRTSAQRTCKIRRTRTPELLLMYAPAAPTGVDTSKTADSRLDSDTTATHREFFYVDYQPAPQDERFKLYSEAEVFAVRASLADTAPGFCWVPGTIKIAHAANPTAQIMTAGVASPVWRKGSAAAQTITAKPGGTAVPTAPYHKTCDGVAQPGLSAAGPGWVAYDDTARTRLASMSASNVPCAGGTPTAQQYLPNTSALSLFTDGAWRYSQGSGGTPTGWRTGQNGLTMQSSPNSNMNAADSAGNRTCVAVPLSIVDCTAGAGDAAFLRDILQLANTSARLPAADRIDTSAPLPYDTNPARAPSWYYPPYRLYEQTSPRDTRGRATHPGSDTPRFFVYSTSTGTVNPIAAFKIQPRWISDPASHPEQAAVCGTAAQIGTPAGVASTADNTPGARKLGTGNDASVYDFPITITTAHKRRAPAGETETDLAQPSPCEFAATATATWQPVLCPADQRYGGGTGDLSEAETFADLDVFAATAETAAPSGKVSLADSDLVLANIAIVDSLSDMIALGYPERAVQKLRTSFKTRGSPCENTQWVCFTVRPAGWGALTHRWLQTRTLRVSFSIALNRWAGAGVSSTEASSPAERHATVTPARESLTDGS